VPSLPCPTCRYDLQGSCRGDELVRCPECGRLTDRAIVAATTARRAEASRRLLAAIALAGGLIALAVVLSVVSPQGWVTGAAKAVLAVVTSPLGIALAPILAVLFLVMSCLIWPRLRKGQRMGFAATTTGLVILTPLPIGLPLLAAWLVGFLFWARPYEG
jgi:hypothetical protein